MNVEPGDTCRASWGCMQRVARKAAREGRIGRAAVLQAMIADCEAQGDGEVVQNLRQLLAQTGAASQVTAAHWCCAMPDSDALGNVLCFHSLAYIDDAQPAVTVALCIPYLCSLGGHWPLISYRVIPRVCVQTPLCLTTISWLIHGLLMMTSHACRQT